MKITSLKTRVVKIPLEKPIKTAIHDIESVACVLLSLRTDDGLEGQAYCFTINGVRIKAFDEMIKGFSHQLIGRDPFYVSSIWRDIWNEINPTGHKGLTISALSTIDTACWDLIGKSLDKPLHHVFGACRDSIKTYASGGLWLSQSVDECIAEAHQFIDDGFRGMKIRLGSKNAKDDIQRVSH